MSNRPCHFFALLCCSLAAGLIGGSPASAAEASAAYLSYLPDVPLLDGLAELPDQSVVFDKAEGRVVETAVLAPSDSEKRVFEFYGKTLPALGWQMLTHDRFLRNNEQLVVKWEKVSDGALVRFSLSPKPPLKQEKNY